MFIVPPSLVTAADASPATRRVYSHLVRRAVRKAIGWIRKHSTRADALGMAREFFGDRIYSVSDISAYPASFHGRSWASVTTLAGGFCARIYGTPSPDDARKHLFWCVASLALSVQHPDARGAFGLNHPLRQAAEEGIVAALVADFRAAAIDAAIAGVTCSPLRAALARFMSTRIGDRIAVGTVEAFVTRPHPGTEAWTADNWFGVICAAYNARLALYDETADREAITVRAESAEEASELREAAE